MEPYKTYGRGSYGRNQNQCSMTNRQNNNWRNSNNQGCKTNAVDNSGCGSFMPVTEASNCGCKDDNHHMTHMPLGMAYVPMQQWGELYDPETAHCQGTAFPDLNLIFCGSRGKM